MRTPTNIHKAVDFQETTPKDYQLEIMKTPLKSEDNPKFVDDFEIQREQLQFKHILGSGACGVVRLASFRDEHDNIIDVAVKMLKGIISILLCRFLHSQSTKCEKNSEVLVSSFPYTFKNCSFEKL